MGHVIPYGLVNGSGADDSQVESWTVGQPKGLVESWRRVARQIWPPSVVTYGPKWQVVDVGQLRLVTRFHARTRYNAEWRCDIDPGLTTIAGG